MTPEQFTYWLQGHCEMNPHDEAPTEAQWAMIKEHLQLVFKKETSITIPLPQTGLEGTTHFPDWTITTPYKIQDQLHNVTLSCC